MLKKFEAFVRRCLAPFFRFAAVPVFRGPARGYRLVGALTHTNIFRRPDQEDLFYQQLSLEGKTVYDIGGYIGERCLVFAAATGVNGRVYSFEPHPDLYELIIRNIEINRLSHVQAFALAVGDGNEDRLLVSSKVSSSTSSMNRERQQELRRDGGVCDTQVSVRTLDRIIFRQKLRTPDFIKIDVEGYEYQALRGMKKTLKRHKPKLVIEMHGTKNTAAIIRMLRQTFGYKIKHIEKGTAVRLKKPEDAHFGHIYCY